MFQYVSRKLNSFKIYKKVELILILIFFPGEEHGVIKQYLLHNHRRKQLMKSRIIILK